MTACQRCIEYAEERDALLKALDLANAEREQAQREVARVKQQMRALVKANGTDKGTARILHAAAEAEGGEKDGTRVAHNEWNHE